MSRSRRQFSVHRIERVYEAIVWGVPPQPAGAIERADRPPSARSQAHGGGRGRQAGADPLPARGGRRPRSPRGCGSSSRPAAPTRSGSISARSASASSAIRSTGRGAGRSSSPALKQHLAGLRPDRAARPRARLRAPGQRRAAALRARRRRPASTGCSSFCGEAAQRSPIVNHDSVNHRRRSRCAHDSHPPAGLDFRGADQI